MEFQKRKWRRLRKRRTSDINLYTILKEGKKMKEEKVKRKRRKRGKERWYTI